MLLSVAIFAQNISVQGNITEDTNWDYDTVFLTGGLDIASDVSLNIAEGTTIASEGYYSIEVNRNILANGTAENNIKFTVADNTNFADTALYEVGGWDGIHFTQSGNMDASEFHYCIFEYGKAVTEENKDGGFFHIKNRDNISFDNCLFENNICLNNGGAIYSNSSNVISNSTIQYNRSYNQGGGFAFIASDCGPIVDNNYFLKNLSDISSVSTKGAAIYISNGYYEDDAKVVQITNNNFIANAYTALYESTRKVFIANNIFTYNYGAIANGNSNGDGAYLNNTIYGNMGMVWFSFSRELTISNNICWGNNSNGPSGISGDSFQSTTHAYISYSNFQTDGLLSESGMISTDPLFVNPIQVLETSYQDETNGDFLVAEFLALEIPDFDFSLQDESPCVNTGTKDIVNAYGMENDIIGNPRVYGNVDMGAIENQSILYSPSITQTVDFSIMPNPAKNDLYIIGDDLSPITQISIYNLVGQEILNITNPSYPIDIKSIDAGKYILNIEKKNSKTENHSFIKL